MPPARKCECGSCDRCRHRDYMRAYYYSSGAAGGWVDLDCEWCGEKFRCTTRNAKNTGRGQGRKFCSRACKDKARKANERHMRLEAKAGRICGACGIQLQPSAKSGTRFCNVQCSNDFHNGRRAAYRKAAKAGLDRACIQCGVVIGPEMRADAKFCSPKCNAAAHGLKRGNGRLGPGRRRDIERAYIIARDSGRCYLCGKKCNSEEMTLDHLVPLSLGGSHDESNLAVACRRCNYSKGNRSRGEQLLLVG